LHTCLEALLNQDHACIDAIMVVDNASEDGSLEAIARSFPDVQVKAFASNQGFSRAFNWGVDQTQGDYLLSLNPDVSLRRNFILEVLEAVGQDDRVGIVAPKLLRAKDPAILDSTGLFIDRRRRPYDRGQGTPDRGQYDAHLHVFGACGAAALYRRSMLEDLVCSGEYFDEAFFAYYEDADLAWRAQSRGWHAVHAPRAVALHDRGWADTLRKRGRATKEATGPRLALRNRYLMTVKNDNPAHLLSDLPLILAAEVPRLLYAALTRPQILLGMLDLMRVLPSAFGKRQQVRSRRTVADAVVRRWFVAPLEVTSSGWKS
jgi:GT2 family glycosyltransferase